VRPRQGLSPDWWLPADPCTDSRAYACAYATYTLADRCPYNSTNLCTNTGTNRRPYISADISADEGTDNSSNHSANCSTNTVTDRRPYNSTDHCTNTGADHLADSGTDAPTDECAYLTDHIPDAGTNNAPNTRADGRNAVCRVSILPELYEPARHMYEYYLQRQQHLPNGPVLWRVLRPIDRGVYTGRWTYSVSTGRRLRRSTWLSSDRVADTDAGARPLR
jgi:hypothetical protein